MEQPCYKCGQAVEEGIPFCPHCSAPQIRVVVAEAAPGSVAAIGVAPAADGTAVLPLVQPNPSLSAGRAHLLKACALAAIVACVLVIFRLNVLAALIGAGFLSVVFYRQRRPENPPNAVAGAGIGALGGLLFVLFSGSLMALASAFPEARARFRDQVLDSAQKWAASRPSDPQVQAAIEQLKSPEGFVMTMIVAGIFFLILCPLIASLGGALAGALFGRRRKL